MSCNYPFLGIRKNEEDKMKFYSIDVLDLFLKDKSRVLAALHMPLDSQSYIISCGQCTECRLQKSREWANRIILECQNASDNWAVTLTYDDDHLPYGDIINKGDERRRYPTLKYEDVQKFNKDLRRYFEYHFGHKDIRFYCAGEYGKNGGRPHYHMLYFNIPFPASDISLSKEKTQTGEDMFESQICNQLWNKGRVKLNLISWKYAGYCARYIMKKQTGKGSKYYEVLGIESEFNKMSNRPGIGYNYVLQHKDELLSGKKIVIRQGDKVMHCDMPRYFIRKLEEEGYDLTKLKEKRLEAAAATFMTNMSLHSNIYLSDFLESQEALMLSKLHSLPRA